MKNRSMIIGSFIGGDQSDNINGYFNERINEEKLPIAIHNHDAEISDDELSKLDGAIMVEVWNDMERAAELLENAVFLQAEGKPVIWFAFLSDELEIEAKNRLIPELTVIMSEQADPGMILDELTSLGEKFEVEEDPRKFKRTKPSIKKPQTEVVVEQESEEDSDLSESNSESKSGNNVLSKIEHLGKSVMKSGKALTFPTKQRVIKEEEEDLDTLPEHFSLPSVIAVAGYSGAGVSHIAWNIAELQQRPSVLLEGRTTGALAAWLGRNSSQTLVSKEKFLDSQIGTQKTEYLDLALLSDHKLNNKELLQLSAINKTIIVDCGTDYESEIFKRAGKKVFVISPDPQHVDLDRPESLGVTWILNRWPPGCAITVEAVEQLYGRKFNLVVTQPARQATMAIWTKKPVIKMETNGEVVEKWLSLFGGVAE